MKIFIKRYSSNKNKYMDGGNFIEKCMLSTKKQTEFTTLNRNNNRISESNINNDDDDDKFNAENFNEDDYSLKVMHLYPLGFNKNEKELKEDEDNNKGVKKNVKETPRKRKIKNNEGKEDENENTVEIETNSVYNVWVPDCVRTRKDFIECQQLDMTLLETKEKFEKELSTNKYFNSINDYEDFKLCSKHSNTRILQGVEIKFGISIDVSDCFYSLTGAKLRAYSFQGPNRILVYSGFSHFKSSWTENMAVKTVTDYDILFQPDNWYYTVIQSEKIIKPVKQMEKKDNENIVEKKEVDEEAINVSNRICLCLNDDSEARNVHPDDNGDVIENRLDSISELAAAKNVNNENKDSQSGGLFSKYHNVLSLCMKYFKIPKIHFKKILFSSYMNETESLSCVISKRSCVVNENNNKHPETLTFGNEIEGNYKLVNFLLDSDNRPIPVWMKLDLSDSICNLSDLKTIKNSCAKSIETV